MNTDPQPKPGRIGVIAIYSLIAAEGIRLLTAGPVQARLPLYLGLLLVYLVLFTVALWRPRLSPLFGHLYLSFQSAVILALLVLDPAMDHVTVFYLSLCYQVAYICAGRMRWIWIGILAVLTGGALMLFHGAIEGLALSLTTIAGIIVIPASVIVNQEIESARAQSEALLAELQGTHARLEAYASQVEELTAMEERSRLARELHDSVSQTMFGITLTIRTAQVLWTRNPAQVKPQLEKLQTLTQNALAQMRTLIAELRPENH